MLDASGADGLRCRSDFQEGQGTMGKIVFAGAMSHVLDPEYYQAACGDVGRQKVTAAMEAIAHMGDRFVEQKADALIVVADDHMNAFSLDRKSTRLNSSHSQISYAV